MLGFDTETRTLRDLLGNGRHYDVPRFQRDYSWTAEEREDLWLDVVDIIAQPGDVAHYMGYLVLQQTGTDRYQIIDGQQRLATLSVLVLAALGMLDALIEHGPNSAADAQRRDELRRLFIGRFDPITLISSPKLTLNRSNNPFYVDRLIPRRPLDAVKLGASNRLLRDAFNDFSARLRSHLGADATGDAIAQFVVEVARRLAFTVIEVNDALNAFKVFETLNARGVRLSPADLLKNHLFSVVDADGDLGSLEAVDALERRWEQLVSRMHAADFTPFLRAHWSGRHAAVSKRSLFKAIRAHARHSADVFALLTALEEDVDVHAALSEPHEILWTPAQSQQLDALRIFGVRQPWPLLLVAQPVLSAGDFTTLLRACVVLSLRFNVVGRLAPGQQARTYAAVAQRVHQGELRSAARIIRALAPIYVADEAFRAAFSRLEVRTVNGRNTHVARYLLTALSRQAGRPVDPSRLTLEHVLPEQLTDAGWAHVTADDHRRYRYRLGNMILLEAALNREAKQADFSAKQAIYARSQLASASALATQAGDWGPEQIDARQRAMARQATAVWRLPQLDR